MRSATCMLQPQGVQPFMEAGAGWGPGAAWVCSSPLGEGGQEASGAELGHWHWPSGSADCARVHGARGTRAQASHTCGVGLRAPRMLAGVTRPGCSAERRAPLLVGASPRRARRVRPLRHLLAIILHPMTRRHLQSLHPAPRSISRVPVAAYADKAAYRGMLLMQRGSQPLVHPSLQGRSRGIMHWL
jgi:hypothetical protein